MRIAPRSIALGAIGALLLVPAGLTAQQLAAPAPIWSVQNPSRGTKPITPTDIKAWKSITQSVLSNDGKWFAYVVKPVEGDATVVLVGTAPGAIEKRFPVGASGGTITISGDSKWMGFIAAPPTRGGGGGGGGGRGGRGGGAGGGGRGGGAGAGATAGGGAAAAPQRDKVVLVNLATGEQKEFDKIRRFEFNGENPTWIAMQGYPPEAAATDATAAAAPAAGRGGRGGGGGGGRGGGGGGGGGAASDLDLYSIATGEFDNVGNVGEYTFDETGDLLAYTVVAANQVGNGIQVRNMKTSVVRSIDHEEAIFRGLMWADTTKQTLAVMRGLPDSVTRDTLYSIVTYANVHTPESVKKVVFDAKQHPDFPAGMKIDVARAPRFSQDMSVVFFGIHEAPKAELGQRTVASTGRGGSVVQAGAPGQGGTAGGGRGGAGGAGGAGAAAGGAPETPSLILWHWKDDRVQPEQIVQEAADRAFNYLTEYRYTDNKVVRLVDSALKTVNVASGDRYAYGTDSREYDQQASITGRRYVDVYSVDLKTGARKLLMKKHPESAMRASPDGRTLLYWGTDGNYWTLDLVTGDERNITKGVATSFVNAEDDHNNIYPVAETAYGWSRDGKSVVLSDGWDMWKVPVDGSAAVNLTGNGKKDQIRYQRFYTFATGAAGGGRGGAGGRGGGAGGRGGGGAGEGIDLSKPLYIATYGEWTKKEGLSRVDPEKPGATPLFFEPAKFALQKARDADVYLYTKQTFVDFPNYWVANADWKGGRQLTDINPQQKDYAWSAGTRLIDYKSDKGAKLQGALYLPANYEPGKKYPLLVTIYEKRSNLLNGYLAPSETRAPDPTQFTSRGYAVLDPDIVYQVNDPGMSAVWCVLPAVKAAIATGIVDAKKVGLWGHSWGGYQTAFLVTQTNVFAAAIAGAPLTNMVSMYGSIYWNTGGTDAAIFESSQGRFKGGFIDNYDAYIRNSPVFHADKVTTPLIILQNDKDGAVDFNQGVTYFNTLRNLGKDVIFLEYVGENHGLAQPVNQKDYAQRMQEFFDFHLKDAPEADWIKNGIPRVKMDEDLKARAAGSGGGAATRDTTNGGRGGGGGGGLKQR